MKRYLIFFFLLMQNVWSSTMINCPLGQFRVLNPYGGVSCVASYPSPIQDCVNCQQNLYQQQMMPLWMNPFPQALFPSQAYPWWATQGMFHYPNMMYPGVWNHQTNQINPQYYPGSGQIFAAKPNVYIESIHREKKFEFEFLNKESEFLITTPLLTHDYKWKGKITNQDRFSLEDIHYDYLFYDLRLPKEQMQFDSGICANRQETIDWMLKDLKEMNYPTIALQDFEEHWKVKIPDLPYFCIYPQYNEELDKAIPVKFELEQVHFTRALYVLVAHKEAPSSENSSVPLPQNDPSSKRVVPKIRYENMFREWGVAFLGE